MTPLTVHQVKRIYRLAAHGATVRGIADQLPCSLSTASKYRAVWRATHRRKISTAQGHRKHRGVLKTLDTAPRNAL